MSTVSTWHEIVWRHYVKHMSVTQIALQVGLDAWYVKDIIVHTWETDPAAANAEARYIENRKAIEWVK